MICELNANSWHTKLANYGRSWSIDPGDNMDICSYTRAVLGGLIRLLCTIIFVVAAAAFFGTALYDIAVWVWGGFVEKLGFCGFMLLGVLVLSGVAVLIFYIKDAMERLSEKVSEKSTDTFVGLAYKKYKDKTCFKIKFK